MNMLAFLDTEIAGSPCLDPQEGHTRNTFKLESQGTDGCIWSLTDSKHSTKLDETLEREFMEANFPDLIKTMTYDETLTDTVQLFAR